MAWQAELGCIPIIAFNFIYTAIFLGDIYIQFNAGYITNSAIILDRQRVTNRYTHYYFYFDALLVLIIIVALAVQTFYLNWPKILIMYKFVRMFEMDALMSRKVSTMVKSRLFYEISKQFVTVYVLSQIWGIFFYLMDLALVNDPNWCMNNNSSISLLI